MKQDKTKEKSKSKKFDFKEYLEDSIIEDRKKVYNNIKEDWRNLILDNPNNKKEKNNDS